MLLDEPTPSPGGHFTFIHFSLLASGGIRFGADVVMRLEEFFTLQFVCNSFLTARARWKAKKRFKKKFQTGFPSGTCCRQRGVFPLT